MATVVPRLLRILSRVSTLCLRTSINGTSFRIPIVMGIGTANLSGQIGDPWVGHLLRLVMPLSKGAFIDVGANIGQTLLQVMAVDKECFYVGFEPNPACVFYLELLRAKNRLPHAQVIALGLGERDDFLPLDFFSRDLTDTCASMVGNFRPGAAIDNSRYVAVVEFDSAKKRLRLPNIGMVKIDVEGGELEVLKGMRDTLRIDRPIVLCEVLHVHNEDRLVEGEKRIEKTASLLHDENYELWRVAKTADGKGLSGFTAVPTFDIKTWDSSSWRFCDYLCLPKERSDEILSVLPGHARPD